MERITASALWARTEVSLGKLCGVFIGSAAGERARLFFDILSACSEPCGLAERMRMSRPRVSKQLKYLSEAGFVRKVRRGRSVFYAAGPSVTLSVHDSRLRIVISETAVKGAGGHAFVVLLFTMDEASVLGLGALAEGLQVGHANGTTTTANGKPDVVTRSSGGPAPPACARTATRLPIAPEHT